MSNAANFFKLYKTWKESKRINEVTQKTVGLSNRVDQLIKDYAAWHSNKSEKKLEEIKTRMRHLKGELALAAAPSPAIPSISTRAVDKYLRENLENALVAEAAKMELTRMYWEQDRGRLPDDGGPAWPPTRARFVSGRDALHQQALKLSVAAHKLNGEIRDVEKLQQELRDIQKEPFFTRDQLDDLEEQYDQRVAQERTLKADQRRFEALAKAFEQASINLDKLIEAGDEVYKQKKK